MNLQVLLKAIQPVKISGSLDRDITAICYDSRKVVEGALFVALPGEKADGTEFIDSAIDRGAAAIVSEKPGLTTRAAAIEVLNARHALADLSAAYFLHHSQ